MRQQDRVARPTDLVDPELAADHVGTDLGHPAQRRSLAAGDRDEPLGAALRRVVDRLERPRQFAAGVGVASRADQRSRGRPRGPLRGGGDRAGRRPGRRALRRGGGRHRREAPARRARAVRLHRGKLPERGGPDHAARRLPRRGLPPRARGAAASASRTRCRPRTAAPARTSTPSRRRASCPTSSCSASRLATAIRSGRS